MPFSIRVAKDYTSFASAHFATFEGDQCEPLHGHNYRVAVSLSGPLDENAFVYNFVPLKKLMRTVCDRLDHRLLLPTGNPHLAITADATSYTIRYRHKTYVIPREDVVQLPIPNTTAECFAEWIGHELLAQLCAAGAQNLTEIAVEVEETIGQKAWWKGAINT
jgi:6-pyruvoyltetrahydropterin/6-carboxytetrahydropterin synthase